MPLDIGILYRRVEQMLISMPDASSRQEWASCQEFLRHADPDLLRTKLRQRERGAARTPWLVAEPLSTLASTFSTPPLPADLSIAAADSSSIAPDRHSSLRYYVLNVGYAVLTYGSAPNAILDARAQFCFEPQELYFDPEGKRIPIEESRLGILMAIEEMAGLHNAAQLALAPVLGLSDGSLILWNLQNEDKELQNDYLHRFLFTLDAFRRDNIPLASYVSFPGSHDVVNGLRVMLCDVTTGGCAHCPQQTESQSLCRFMGGVWDRQLFQGLLRPGQRTDIFQSQSAILDQYGEHHIQFFYLNVGGEIARIEAPQWVMANSEMLDLVHSAVIDQCRKSGQYPPYPSVLMEAHEQAVISTADRQAVEELVEQILAARGITYVRSAKDRSKRSRGV